MPTDGRIFVGKRLPIASARMCSEMRIHEVDHDWILQETVDIAGIISSSMSMGVNQFNRRVPLHDSCTRAKPSEWFLEEAGDRPDEDLLVFVPVQTPSLPLQQKPPASRQNSIASWAPLPTGWTSGSCYFSQFLRILPFARLFHFTLWLSPRPSFVPATWSLRHIKSDFLPSGAALFPIQARMFIAEAHHEGQHPCMG